MGNSKSTEELERDRYVEEKKAEDKQKLNRAIDSLEERERQQEIEARINGKIPYYKLVVRFFLREYEPGKIRSDRSNAYQKLCESIFASNPELHSACLRNYNFAADIRFDKYLCDIFPKIEEYFFTDYDNSSPSYCSDDKFQIYEWGPQYTFSQHFLRANVSRNKYLKNRVEYKQLIKIKIESMPLGDGPNLASLIMAYA